MGWPSSSGYSIPSRLVCVCVVIVFTCAHKLARHDFARSRPCYRGGAKKGTGVRRFLSLPGSAWERTACEALPRGTYGREAEPPEQFVPRQSLGTRINTKKG